MNFCLSRDGLEKFLESHYNSSEIDDEDLRFLIQQCFDWESNLAILVYFFTHYIQKKINSGKPVTLEQIDTFFDLANVGSFEIELLNRDFIKYMLNHSRNKIGESLEDALIILLQNYKDHTHDSSLCF